MDGCCDDIVAVAVDVDVAVDVVVASIIIICSMNIVFVVVIIAATANDVVVFATTFQTCIICSIIANGFA